MIPTQKIYKKKDKSSIRFKAKKVYRDIEELETQWIKDEVAEYTNKGRHDGQTEDDV